MTAFSSWIGKSAVILVVAIIAFFHLWHMSTVPNGLFQDETAIGYNAYEIAETGYDEHHYFLPVYFESFGDYKAPVYVYTVAGFFKIFGASVFMLRFTSAFFFLLTLLGSIFFLSTVTKKNDRRMLVYALLALGFLPWFFTLSRISFEVISQTTFFIWSLWCVERVYHTKKDAFSILAFVSGLCGGVLLYTYPTSRVLTPLLALCLLALYARPSTWKRTIVMIVGFLVALIPYVFYSIQNPGAMTARFKGITYIFDASLSLLQKVQMFGWNYVQYFSPRFLLLHGDNNLRHATQFGGEVSVIVFVLALVGIVSFFAIKKLRRTKILQVLFFATLTAPLAASLTSDGTPHALRSILLGLCFFLWSCIGMQQVLHLKSRMWRSILVILIFFVLIGQSAWYVFDYETRYKEISMQHFGTAGLPEALQIAQKIQPHLLILSNSINSANIEFFRRLYPLGNVQVLVAPPIPKEQSCVLYTNEDTPIVESSALRSTKMEIPNAFLKFSCFPDSSGVF